MRKIGATGLGLVVALALVACGDEVTQTPLPGKTCTVPADCEATLATRGYAAECTTVTCDASRCVFTAVNEGGSCGEGDACVTGGVCANRLCVGEAVVCDDGDPCTTDACDPATGGCTTTPAPGEPCDDGVACTEKDVCQLDGQCLGQPSATCQCAEDADCAALAETDKCAGTFVCGDDFACHADPATVIQCDTSGDTECAGAVCDPATGGCVLTATNEGQPCGEAADDCTGQAVCTNGACAGEAVACDDGDPCTTDECVPGQGCVYEPATGLPCDDGDPCTSPDVCQAGQCQGAAASCDDGNPCTVDACDPVTGQCSHTASDEPCDDGNPCTTGDSCSTGVCKGAGVACDDGNPCTADVCQVGDDGEVTCAHQNVFGVCDDGDPCTGGDACLGGQCVGTEKLCGCSSDQECQDKAPDDLCVGAWLCDTSVTGGKCVPDPATVVTCQANETMCTIDQCDPATGTCKSQPKPDATPCDDGNACSTGDICSSGVCVGNAMDCSDGNPCTGDLCSGGVCSNQPLGGSMTFLDVGFDAGLPDGWTAETTTEGVGWKVSAEYAAEGDFGLVATGPSGVYDHGAVTATLRSPKFWVYGETVQLRLKMKTGFASPTVGADKCFASNDYLSVGVDNYGLLEQVECVSGDAPDWVQLQVDLSFFKNREIGLVFVFHADAEDNGGFGAAIDEVEVSALFTCTDGPCTIGSCTAGACNAGPLVCDDGDPCTLDTCSATTGKCQYKLQVNCGCESDFDCLTFSPCLQGTCGPDGFCEETVITGACDDQDACTVNDVCNEEGECLGDDIVCDDGVPCTDDWCDYSGECVFQFKPLACDDGDACTTNDTCTSASTCAGSPVVCASGSCASGYCSDGSCKFSINHDGSFELEEGFDSLAPNQLPAEWTDNAESPGWSWKSTTTASHSAPTALGLMGPASAYAAATVSVTAPAVSLPPDGGTLRYWVRGTWGDQGCTTDVLRVKVNGTVVDTVCANVPAFAERTVDLAAFATQLATVSFEFSAKAADAGAVSLLLDDVAVTAKYLCDDGDACTTNDACVLGFCQGQDGLCP